MLHTGPPFRTGLDLYPKRAGLAIISHLFILDGSRQQQPTWTKR